MLQHIFLLLIQAIVSAIKRFTPPIRTIRPATGPPERPTPALPNREGDGSAPVVEAKKSDAESDVEGKPTTEPLPDHSAEPVTEPHSDFHSAIGRENPVFKMSVIAESQNSTVSALHHRDYKICLILEDGYRSAKEYGRTRIPAGTYELVKRRSGRFYLQYKKEHGHGFVVELKNVLGFKFILIHIGNTVLDTNGCLLTGSAYTQRNDVFEVTDSTAAYKTFYKAVSAELARGRVWLEIKR